MDDINLYTLMLENGTSNSICTRDGQLTGFAINHDIFFSNNRYRVVFTVDNNREKQ